MRENKTSFVLMCLTEDSELRQDNTKENLAEISLHLQTQPTAAKLPSVDTAT